MFNLVIPERITKRANQHLLKLSEISEMIRRSWRLILGVVLFFIFVSFVVTLILPKKWETSATLQIAKLPSVAGDISSIEAPQQSVDRINNIEFKEKILADLQLPTTKGQDQRSDILLDTLIARPIENTEHIYISVSAYSAQDALKSLQTAIAELQAAHAPMTLPTKDHLNKELQTINHNLAITDNDISALGHQTSRGGVYSAAKNLQETKVSARRALQLQQDQLNNRLSLIDELSTKPIDSIHHSDKPTFPNRSVFLILAALLGLLSGIGIAWWKDKKIGVVVEDEKTN